MYLLSLRGLMTTNMKRFLKDKSEHIIKEEVFVGEYQQVEIQLTL